MGLQTTASSAKKDTKSLRVTIPEGIVEYLDLEDGDKLEWNMEGSVAKPSASIRKAKKN